MHDDGVHFFCIQEHRLVGDGKISDAKAWCQRSKLRLYAEPALETDAEGPLATSAGTAVLAALHIGARPVDISETIRQVIEGFGGQQVGIDAEWVRARLQVVVIDAGFRHGFALASLYCLHAIGVSGPNVILLEVLAATLDMLGLPWVVGGDWNLSPAELEQSSWLSVVDGAIKASGSSTCAGGAGNELDFFVVSVAFNQGTFALEQVHHAGTSPHVPVLMRISNVSYGHVVQQRIKPKKFPFAGRKFDLSTLKPFPQVSWDWKAGLPCSLPLGDAYSQWVSNVETGLIAAFDIPAHLAGRYRGRAQGMQLRLVDLDAIHKTKAHARLSPEARFWKSLRRAAVQVVGKGRSCLAGRTMSSDLARTVLTFVALFVQGACFWSKAGGPELQDLLCDLLQFHIADVGNSNARTIEALRFIESHAKEAMNASARAAADSWAAWKLQAYTKGRRAAHAFA